MARSRPELDPDTIIGTCRFCEMPIHGSQYWGRSKNPRFHSYCRATAVRMAGGYRQVGWLFHQPEDDVPKPPRGGFVRAYRRAWALRKQGVDVPLPEHPTHAARRLRKAANALNSESSAPIKEPETPK
jgi:hypothetical protein